MESRRQHADLTERLDAEHAFAESGPVSRSHGGPNVSPQIAPSASSGRAGRQIEGRNRYGVPRIGFGVRVLLWRLGFALGVGYDAQPEGAMAADELEILAVEGEQVGAKPSGAHGEEDVVQHLLDFRLTIRLA